MIRSIMVRFFWRQDFAIGEYRLQCQDITKRQFVGLGRIKVQAFWRPLQIGVRPMVQPSGADSRNLDHRGPDLEPARHDLFRNALLVVNDR